MKFRDIFQSWKRKNPIKKELKQKGKWGSKEKMPDNIYGSKTYGEEWENFDKFHYGLKYRVMVPLLRFIEWKWGEVLNRPIPQGKHNDMLLMFDKCYDEALSDWNRYYLQVQDKWSEGKNKPIPYSKRRAARIYHNQLLNTMKNIMKTGYLYDSAYREFANILMMKLYLAQRAMFQDKKQLTHLFYASKDTRQISYFKIYQEVKDIAQNVNKDVKIIPLEQMEEFKKEVIEEYKKNLELAKEIQEIKLPIEKEKVKPCEPRKSKKSN